MTIERTKNEIIIRVPASLETSEIQDVLDFIRYKELTSKVSTRQSVVDSLAASINKKWWKKNSKRILNEGSR